MARTKKQILKYNVKMSKRKNKIRWLVIEQPTGSIIVEDSNSDFLPNIPSVMMTKPSMYGGRSRLSSRGAYRRR